MTALFKPSMPIEIAPERLTLAFSSRTTLAFGFFSFAFRAAIGPAVPPPMTSTSQETSESPSTISSSAITCSWFAGPAPLHQICSGGVPAIAISCRRDAICASALDEGLFNDEMAGLAVVTLDKAARGKHRGEFLEHRRAAAQHDAIGLDIEAGLADVVEQLIGGDQIGDAAAV